jgi:hypothetical protein
MLADDDIWNLRGTLSRARDQADGVEVPPLPEDTGALRPLREILADYVSASPAEREQYSLILENGQAFAADDIAELLARPDSPFNRAR